MTTEQKNAVDAGLVAWSWSFPYTLSEASEFVQLIAGLLSIILVLLRIYGIFIKDE